MRKLSKSDRQFWKDYGIDPGVPESDSMTTEQLGEVMLQTVQAMDKDQKAHFRAKLSNRLGLLPKLSGGKPS